MKIVIHSVGYALTYYVGDAISKAHGRSFGTFVLSFAVGFFIGCGIAGLARLTEDA